MNTLQTQVSQTELPFDISCRNLHWDQEDQFQDELDELTDVMTSCPVYDFAMVDKILSQALRNPLSENLWKTDKNRIIYFFIIYIEIFCK